MLSYISDYSGTIRDQLNDIRDISEKIVNPGRLRLISASILLFHKDKSKFVDRTYVIRDQWLFIN